MVAIKNLALDYTIDEKKRIVKELLKLSNRFDRVKQLHYIVVSTDDMHLYDFDIYKHRQYYYLLHNNLILEGKYADVDYLLCDMFRIAKIVQEFYSELDTGNQYTYYDFTDKIREMQEVGDYFGNIELGLENNHRIL